VTAIYLQPAETGVRPLHFHLLLLTLAIVTLATRIGYFSNPNLHIDDQFYLFVGQRMLEGELPYVDVWDRKPLGLFVIYAGIASLGGGGVLQYQLVAALFVLATAAVIALFASRLASPRGAVLASALYIILLPALGGEGGQAPIFYNLPMAAAALLTFDALECGHQGAMRRALGAMLLCGLAMTVKQTSLFEGVAFGLLHLLNFRRSGCNWPLVAMKGAALLAIALLPTAAIYATYVLLGHGEAIWQATVLSVLAKGPIPLSDTGSQIIEVLVVLTMPLALAAASFRKLAEDRPGLRQTFFVAWGLGAVAGYLSVPNFFDHYALPLVVPICVLASRIGEGRSGLLGFLLAAAIAGLFHEWEKWGSSDRQQMDRLVAEIRSGLGDGCLYIYAGPVYPYSATGACHPTRFVFPDHLESKAEATALPVDPAIEVQRVLEARPTVVVTAPRILYARNADIQAILKSELASSYRKTAVVKFGLFPVTVWHLRDEAARPGRRVPAQN
jgi:hypothetical protein